MSTVTEIVGYLEQLKNDGDVHRKFKEKAENIISLLQTKTELAVQKAILDLEELDSGEMSSYCRTQVWNVIGMLESIKH